MITGMHVVVYAVRDMAAARRFYEAILDLAPDEFERDSYVEYTLPDGAAFALGHDAKHPLFKCSGAVFGTDDLARATERAREAGARIVERFDGPICRSVWCADPDGNEFGIHQRTR